MRVLDLAESKPRPTPTSTSPATASASRTAQLTLTTGRTAAAPNSPSVPGAALARTPVTRPATTSALATGGTIVKVPEGLDSLSFYGAGMVKKKHKFRKREALNSESSDEGTQADAVITGQSCLHVNKSVNLNASKKALRQIGVSGDCTTCLNNARKTQKRRPNRKRQEDLVLNGKEEDLILNGDEENGIDDDDDDSITRGDDDDNEAASSAEPTNESTTPASAAATTTVKTASPVKNGTSSPTSKDGAIWLCLQCGHQGCGDTTTGHVLAHFKVPRSASHALVVNTSTWVVFCFECNDEIQPEPGKALAEAVNFIRKSTGLGKLHKGVKKPSGEKSEVESHKSLLTSSSRTAFAGKVMVIKGLNNLGNTCFFNSVVQNVNQTPLIESVLAETIKKGRKLYLPGYNPEDEIGFDASDDRRRQTASSTGSEEYIGPLPGLDVVLQDGGQLTNAMVNFLAEMNAPSAKLSVISPGNLFTQICKKTPRFKGFQQQDAHELLRHLLDAMRAEEVKRMKAAILKSFGLPENVNPKNVDEKTKAKLKAYGRQANHTVIDGIFGGQLISTIACSQCQSLNQVFEGFLDLSLPIIEEKGVPPLLRGGGEDKTSASVANGLLDVETQLKRPFSKHAEKLKKKTAKREAKKAASRRGSAIVPKEGEGAGANGLPVAPEAEALAPYDELADELQRLNVTEKQEREAASAMDSEAAFKTIWIPRKKPVLPGAAAADEAAAGNGAEELEQFNQIEGQDDSAESEDEFTAAMKSISDMPLETSPDEWVVEEKSKITSPGAAVPSPSSTASSSTVSAPSQAIDLSPDVDLPPAPIEIDAKSNSATTASAKTVDALTATTASPPPPPPKPRQVEESCLSEMDMEPPSDADVEDNDETDARLLLPQESLEASVTETEINESKMIFVTNENGEFTSEICNGNVLAAASAASISSEADGKKKAAGTAQLGQKYCPKPQECSILSSLNNFTAAELLTGPNKFGCEVCTERAHSASKACSPTVEVENRDGKEEEEEEEELVVPEVKATPPKTVYCNASKQLLIHTPPAVLTLHLKRFQQCGTSLRKINKHVEFPLLLDMSPFCSSSCQTIQPGQEKVMYSLYGVVEHSGRMSGGHYVAFVKVRPLSRRSGVFINDEFNTSLTVPDVDLTPPSPSSGAAGPGSRRVSATFKGTLPSAPKTVPTDPVAGNWFYVSDTHVVEVTEAKVLKAQAYLLFYERIY